MGEKRVCNVCKIEKTITDFVKSKKNYYRHKCKKCSNEQTRKKRYELNPKELIPNDMKKCGKCKLIKNLREFHLSTKRKCGYSSYCKKCKKEYVINNSEKEKQRKKNWYMKNRELTIRRNRERLKNNPEKRKKYLRDYYKKKPYIYLWRSLVYRTLRGTLKDSETIKLLGYNSKTLKSHLESHFTKNMSWENYGEWHVDHIKPICSFEIETPLSVINSLDNLRPMWATNREIDGIFYEGNLNKGGRI
jgi:hypothetical protein